MYIRTLKSLGVYSLSLTCLNNAKWRIQLLKFWLFLVAQAIERVHGWVYSYYYVFIIFILSYVSHIALVSTQYGIGGMWNQFIDNILRTMITSKKELIFLSTENQVFAVLVAHFWYIWLAGRGWDKPNTSQGNEFFLHIILCVQWCINVDWKQYSLSASD